MQTATAAMLELDVKRNRARQEATALVMWLRERGYVAPACTREAVYDLAEAFEKDGVEITNREQRELAAKMRPATDEEAAGFWSFANSIGR